MIALPAQGTDAVAIGATEPRDSTQCSEENLQAGSISMALAMEARSGGSTRLEHAAHQVAAVGAEIGQ